MTRQKAIAKKCLECSGNAKEVTLCHLFDCPLWSFRTGSSLKVYKERMKRAFSRYQEEWKELEKMGIKKEDFIKNMKR